VLLARNNKGADEMTDTKPSDTPMLARLIEECKSFNEEFRESSFALQRQIEETRNAINRVEKSLLDKGPRYQLVGRKSSLHNPRRIIKKW
jgi:hypothetical protein